MSQTKVGGDGEGQDRSVEQCVARLLAAVGRATSAEDAVSEIANGLVDRVGAKTTCVYLLDADRGMLVASARRNVDADERRAKFRMTLDDPSGVASAARTRRPVMARAGATTTVATPLISGAILLGAVSSDFEDPFTARDAAVVCGAADIFGPLLERVVLLAKTRELADEQHRQEERALSFAHELREGLHIIQAHALLLSRRVVEHSARASVEGVLHGARRLTFAIEGHSSGART